MGHPQTSADQADVLFMPATQKTPFRLSRKGVRIPKARRVRYPPYSRVWAVEGFFCFLEAFIGSCIALIVTQAG